MDPINGGRSSIVHPLVPTYLFELLDKLIDINENDVLVKELGSVREKVVIEKPNAQLIFVLLVADVVKLEQDRDQAVEIDQNS
jgi:hypothetical protein